MTSRTPQELMRLFQEGDEEAFAELVRRYKDPITSFAMRMLNDAERAVDVAQETFVRVFTHARTYRPIPGFSAWLYRIAYNIAINEIRRQRRQPVTRLGPNRDDGQGPRGAGVEAPDAAPSALEAILGSERRRIVRRCVACLPARYRGAIVLKDMEGLTFEQIASILGCPESTVKSRVVRARRMLRTRLERFLGAGPAAASAPQPLRQEAGS